MEFLGLPVLQGYIKLFKNWAYSAEGKEAMAKRLTHSRRRNSLDAQLKHLWRVHYPSAPYDAQQAFWVLSESAWAIGAMLPRWGEFHRFMTRHGFELTWDEDAQAYRGTIAGAMQATTLAQRLRWDAIWQVWHLLEHRRPWSRSEAGE